MTKTKANLLLVIAAMIWGSTFTVTKYATEVFSSYFIIAFRFTIAAVLLSIPSWKRRKNLDFGYWKAGAVMGVTLFFTYIIQTLGLSMGTSPGKSAFLTAIYCVLVPFLYWMFTKKRPEKNHVIAAFLCLIGIAFISLSGGWAISKGDTVTLFGGVVCAISLVVIALCCGTRDPLLLTMTQLWTVSVLSWIAVLCTDSFPMEYTPVALYGTIYLGVFATALCLLIQTIGLKYTSASVAAIIFSLESVFGVLFSLAFYGEVLTVRTVIGFVLVFVSILLAQKSPKKVVAEKID